jgi:endoglucanase
MPMRSARRRTRLAGTTVLTTIAGVATTVMLTVPAASASATRAHPGLTADRTLPASTRLFVPPPESGAIDQIKSLLKSHDITDAALIAKMESIPRAVWFTGGTPAQVQQQVQQTMAQARIERAVPVLVAYDIPGRDCAQFSAGGALNQADYQAWISSFAGGIGGGKAIVILEPDALGLLPSNCGGPSPNYPFTDTERLAELNFAVGALEADPGVRVYLDGTHSAWLSVGDITHRLLEAGVQQAQGFFVNVSNFQATPQLTDYGTWISDCIAIVTDPTNPNFNTPGNCASQYFPASPSDFSTWGLTTQWYAQNMGNSVATTHFVMDTSRDGNGPNNMSEFGQPPFNQSAATVATLASNNWCNPPGAGLGLRPATATGVPLLDAYLWVKTPGESDGQCDIVSGVRAWDFSVYTQPGWPATAAGQALFDPLWGMDDPAAGAYFPQQALQLAQEASPALF